MSASQTEEMARRGKILLEVGVDFFWRLKNLAMGTQEAENQILRDALRLYEHFYEKSKISGKTTQAAIDGFILGDKEI